MTRTTSRNLTILVAQLFVTESLWVLRVTQGGFPWRWSFAPIVLATIPYLALIEKSYLDFAESLAVNAPFVAIMIFAVKRNHIVFGCVCLFLVQLSKSRALCEKLLVFWFGTDAFDSMRARLADAESTHPR